MYELRAAGNRVAHIVALRVALQETVDVHVGVVIALKEIVEFIILDGPLAEHTCFQRQAEAGDPRVAAKESDERRE